MARLKGFQKLTLVEEASKAFLQEFHIRKPEIATISLSLALNRVLAEHLTAGEDLPRHSRSAVDGYAVKAKDTAGSSQFKPRIVTLAEKDAVGDKEARQVWTGNVIPAGADAVAMLEYTKRIDGKIEVWMSLTPGENVSKKGEDIKKGEIAVRAGTRLKPHHLGLLTALGKTEIKVFQKPKIAILATGNELVEVGNRRRGDQIFDVNRQVISALCRELGAEPLDLGIAKDNLKEISEKLMAGLEAEMVITTGGTSVGASDLVPEAVNRIGKPGVIVHGVAMRPAMPTALAVANGKPILIFPGNPVAAVIAFEVFARPLICRMIRLRKEESRPMLKARMTKRIATTLGRKTFVRVNVFQQDGEFFAEPISARGSGTISTMTRSNGYVIVPENREGLEKEEMVSVRLFDSVETVDDHVQKTGNV